VSDQIKVGLFILSIALLDAAIGGAITAKLQQSPWDERAKRILRRYQEAFFVLAAGAAYWLLSPRELVLAAVLWLCYVEDLLYYWWLSTPPVRVIHLALIGDSQRVQTGEPDPLWRAVGDAPVPWGYLPPHLGGWLVRLPGKLSQRPSRRWACRLALLGTVIVIVV